MDTDTLTIYLDALNYSIANRSAKDGVDVLANLNDEEIKEVLNSAKDGILSGIKLICQPILTMIPATDELRIKELRNVVFSTQMNDVPHIEEIRAQFTNSAEDIRVLAEIWAIIHTKSVLNAIQEIAAARYTAQTTYGQIQRERELISNLVGSLDYSTEPDKELAADIQSFTNLTQTKEEEWPDFLLRVNKYLYHLSTLCDLILSTRKNRGINDPIDLDEPMKIAPGVIKILLTNRSHTLRDIIPLNNQLTINTNTTNETLDIA